MIEAELLAIIARAAEERPTSLNLLLKGIKTISPEIAQLTNLTALYLVDNQIAEIPEVIAPLPSAK